MVVIAAIGRNFSGREEVNTVMNWIYARNAAVAAFVAAAGLGAGFAVGADALTGFVTGRSRAAVLLYRPSFDHVKSVLMLNSQDELRRLAGYYALLQNRTLDADYLLARYREEQNPVTRRTILWIMGFVPDPSKAYASLESVYDDAPGIMQRQILRSLARVDPGSLDRFARDHLVDAGAAYESLESMYDNVPRATQRRIVRAIAHLAPGRLEQFAAAHGIDPAWLREP
ncbi:MAG: hypothetical protein EPN93_14860 [Spirochaetes bacterium]|nr:MAG: hypothetical protein EPN93_14860 [Spirochaetota bacterium]